MYKVALEKNDNFSDDTKERKKEEIEILFSEVELLDMSLMPSDVYYPPRQLSFQEKVALLLMMIAITTRLTQIVD